MIYKTIKKHLKKMLHGAGQISTNYHWEVMTVELFFILLGIIYIIIITS